MNNDVKQVSGFAKKKFLVEAGFAVEKLHNPSLDVEEWCVMHGGGDGSVIIASDRLQGVAVTKAIEALGGM